MDKLLELKNVTKIFKHGVLSHSEITAINNVSFTLSEESPTILSVAGESGSGKTTLAMLLLGFISPSSGQIYYKGKDISKLRGEEKITFRREVQAVFQDPFAVFNPFYPVDHLLTVPIKRFHLAKSKNEVREKIFDALTAVGLHPQDILGKFPHQLSGGQRQRINIARALLLRPKVLLADEPVSMVDASLRATILDTLSLLQKNYGVSIIYITHDLTTAYHISESIIILYRGSVMEAGDVEPVIKDPQHPYTKLLIDSIPWPDINRHWGTLKIEARDSSEVTHLDTGCRFYARCPFAMEKCKVTPPLFQVSDTQATACYLYEKSPVLDSEDLNNVLPM